MKIILTFLDIIDWLTFGLVRRSLASFNCNLNHRLGNGQADAHAAGRATGVEVPTAVRPRFEPDPWVVYDALNMYPYDKRGEGVQLVVEHYWEEFDETDKALEICSFVTHECYRTNPAAYMQMVLEVYEDPRARIDLIGRLAQGLPGPIQLNLRGHDEAVPDDTMDGACAVCHVKKACVLLTCCGKVLFCNSCAQNLYQGKEVGTMQCMNCQGIVTQGQTALF